MGLSVCLKILVIVFKYACGCMCAHVRISLCLCVYVYVRDTANTIFLSKGIDLICRYTIWSDLI